MNNRYVTGLLGLILTGWLLVVAKAVFMPLALAGMLAIVLLPICKGLERWNVPTLLAAIVCGLIFACLVLGILFLVGWNIGNIGGDMTAMSHRFSDLLEKVNQLAGRWGLKMPSLDTGFVGKMTTSVLGVLMHLVLILVYLIMLLTMRDHIKTYISKLSRPGLNGLLDRSTVIVRQYLYGLGMIIVYLWILYGLAFWLIGVQYAIFFALLCGVLEIIPFIGGMTGITLTCIMALSQGGHTAMILEILGSYLVIQGTQFYIVSPLVMRAQVHIHPLFTIVILIAGELLWGIPGMILAIPAVGIAKILLDESGGDLKALGFLLGREKPPRRAGRKD